MVVELLEAEGNRWCIGVTFDDSAQLLMFETKPGLTRGEAMELALAMGAGLRSVRHVSTDLFGMPGRKRNDCLCFRTIESQPDCASRRASVQIKRASLIEILKVTTGGPQRGSERTYCPHPLGSADRSRRTIFRFDV
jgi:hypothetical protein